MIRGGKPSWRTIRVQGPAASRDELRELDTSERLAALYRLQIGQAPSDHCFFTLVDGQRRATVGDPADVDWDMFPVLAALEAVTRDELRRLRHILRADPANLVDEDPPAPTSSGTWALPAFDGSAPLRAVRERSATAADPAIKLPARPATSREA
jgi:hypothetical protein